MGLLHAGSPQPASFRVLLNQGTACQVLLLRCQVTRLYVLFQVGGCSPAMKSCRQAPRQDVGEESGGESWYPTVDTGACCACIMHIFVCSMPISRPLWEGVMGVLPKAICCWHQPTPVCFICCQTSCCCISCSCLLVKNQGVKLQQPCASR